MATPAIQCSNRECRVAENGKCVEGLSTDTCPNYGQPLASIEPEQSPPADTLAIELSGAERLSLDEAAAVLQRDEGRVVAVMGPHDAGKTSLIAGLYDMFQHGPIGSYHFNGSKTLHAFEMSCHDARAASERNVPHINRTPLGEVEFFHIGINQLNHAPSLALLIGDRAGEDYRSASDDASIASGFHEVKRADTLTFLVDGKRLAHSVTRHQVRNELLRLVQALSDSGATSPRQRMAIVLTKLDDVRASDHAARSLADFSADVGKLRELFSNKFETIAAFEVAASPKTTTIQRGTGLADLLSFWLRSPPAATGTPCEAIPDERVFRRQKGA